MVALQIKLSIWKEQANNDDVSNITNKLMSCSLNDWCPPLCGKTKGVQCKVPWKFDRITHKIPSVIQNTLWPTFLVPMAICSCCLELTVAWLQHGLAHNPMHTVRTAHSKFVLCLPAPEKTISFAATILSLSIEMLTMSFLLQWSMSPCMISSWQGNVRQEMQRSINAEASSPPACDQPHSHCWMCCVEHDAKETLPKGCFGATRAACHSVSRFCLQTKTTGRQMLHTLVLVNCLLASCYTLCFCIYDGSTSNLQSS